MCVWIEQENNKGEWWLLVRGMHLRERMREIVRIRLGRFVSYWKKRGLGRRVIPCGPFLGPVKRTANNVKKERDEGETP